MRKLRFRIGFTLLELLIACALMVLFQGIALPRYLSVARMGKEARAMADLHLLRVAVEALIINESPSELPGDMESLLETLRETPVRIIDWPEELFDPFQRPNTRYRYFRNGRCYVIFSTGPDEEEQIQGITEECRVKPADTGDDIFVTNGDKVAI